MDTLNSNLIFAINFGKYLRTGKYSQLRACITIVFDTCVRNTHVTVSNPTRYFCFEHSKGCPI